MIFQNNLFFIDSSYIDDGWQTYSIRINPEHVIYKAHFPGEPITPGVCILQIGLELLSIASGKKLEVSTVKNVKFLNILTPDRSGVVFKVKSEELEDGSVKGTAEVRAEEELIAKMSLICQIVQ